MSGSWRKVASKARRKARSKARDLAEGRPLPGMPGWRRSNLGYVFILTYGRSGSTLLQGILDSIPGYLIRGENRGVLYQLYKFHSTVVARKKELQSDFKRLQVSDALPSTHAWYGLDGYPEDLALRDMRRLVLDTILRPTARTRVTGFKEIRWSQKDLDQYIGFIRALFPGARFIVNTRSHEAVSHSHWWAEDPDALTKIKQREDQLLQIAERLGDSAYRVHYDDYVADPTVLRGLFDWLGEDFDEAAVRRTLDRKHSV